MNFIQLIIYGRVYTIEYKQWTIYSELYMADNTIYSGVYNRLHSRLHIVKYIVKYTVDYTQ